MKYTENTYNRNNKTRIIFLKNKTVKNLDNISKIIYNDIKMKETENIIKEKGGVIPLAR